MGDKICPIEVKSGNYRGKFGNLSNQHSSYIVQSVCTICIEL